MISDILIYASIILIIIAILFVFYILKRNSVFMKDIIDEKNFNQSYYVKLDLSTKKVILIDNNKKLFKNKIYLLKQFIYMISMNKESRDFREFLKYIENDMPIKNIEEKMDSIKHIIPITFDLENKKYFSTVFFSKESKDKKFIYFNIDTYFYIGETSEDFKNFYKTNHIKNENLIQKIIDYSQESKIRKFYILRNSFLDNYSSIYQENNILSYFFMQNIFYCLEKMGIKSFINEDGEIYSIINAKNILEKDEKKYFKNIKNNINKIFNNKFIHKYMKLNFDYIYCGRSELDYIDIRLISLKIDYIDEKNDKLNTAKKIHSSIKNDLENLHTYNLTYSNNLSKDKFNIYDIYLENKEINSILEKASYSFIYSKKMFHDFLVLVDKFVNSEMKSIIKNSNSIVSCYFNFENIMKYFKDIDEFKDMKENIFIKNKILVAINNSYLEHTFLKRQISVLNQKNVEIILKIYSINEIPLESLKNLKINYLFVDKNINKNLVDYNKFNLFKVMIKTYISKNYKILNL